MKIVTKFINRVQTGKYSEQQLLDGLKNGNENCYTFIRKRNLPIIREKLDQYLKVIMLDVEDVIQEGLIRLIMNIRNNKFREASSIHSYFIGICINICRKEYPTAKKFKSFEVNEEITGKIEADSNDIYNEIDNFMKYEHNYSESNTNSKKDFNSYDLLQKVIEIKKRLNEKCIEIINLRFNLGNVKQFQLPSLEYLHFKEVAKRLNIDYANARKRFSRCIEQLISEVNKEQELSELIKNLLNEI
ncbi:MAG: sigma-70 family RNA polymerase sigma factor [Bacteroidetes bacterium]|nr:sigma-70 family RNA polymerase sigma factor [Bacteroidota bacterium]